MSFGCFKYASGVNRRQANPRKAQKSQLHPTEAERYRKKLLAKAEIIVASANKIWGMYNETLDDLE
jgi:DNA polymerase theta